jgi:predicted nucleic acid-binding protein
MSDRVRLLDVNFLIALSVDSHVHHAAAHAALAGFQDG